MSTLTVPETWFETTSLADDVTLIREPHIEWFIRANMWHVRGRDRDLLIDTGMGVRSLRRELAFLAEKPVMCVATHCHFDHWGGLHEFDERLGHTAEAEVFAAPTGASTVAALYVNEQSFLRPPAVDYEPASYTVRAAPLTREVDEGDVIDLGDRVLRVLHLPGHSPGEIGLWEEARGILFSGDAIYDGPLFDDLYHSVPEDYRETMRRLLELPVEVVHGGHLESFGRTRMIELAEDYLAGRRRPECPAEGAEPAGVGTS